MDSADFVNTATGKVVRQTGPASAVEVVTGLDFPIAMAFGPDGGLYVAYPAFGADPPAGAIVRLDVAQGQVLTIPGELLAGSSCAAATPSAAASPPPSGATPAAGPATPSVPGGGPAASPPAGTPAPNDGGKGGTGGLAVQIQNFAFNPPTLQVPAGTTVTWTNLDSTPHTATSTTGAFDSGNLNPGQSFSFAFEQAGTFDYLCRYHPSMRGSIVVQ